MIGARLELTATLVVLTPLHIGTGTRRSYERGDETGTASEVARDQSGKPCLPGSSLKGALRDHVAAKFANLLFGPDKISGPDDAQSGRVIFRNAWYLADPPEKATRVASGRTLQGPEASTFVEAHVSRNPDAGVADKALLFHDDMVVPGTTFTLSLAALKPDDVTNAALQALLRAMAAPNGFALGHATRQGLGRLKLLPNTLKVRLHPQARIDTAVWQKAISLPPDGTKPKWRLRLTSDGPFLIHDPHRAPPVAKPGDADRNNTLQALQRFDGEGPRLTGSSLLGALRARFDDFAKRNQKADATDRLFGKTDNRGRIAILVLKPDGEGAPKIIPSVRIDRFSGATIDNALFMTEGWLGCRFALDLTAETRGDTEQQGSDDALFERFLAEVCDPVWGGLMLGHGSNKGYGWFGVEVRK